MKDLKISTKTMFKLICVLAILVGISDIYKTKIYFKNTTVEVEEIKAIVDSKYIDSYNSENNLFKSKSDYDEKYNVVLKYYDNVSIIESKTIYDNIPLNEEIDAQVILHRDKDTQEIKERFIVPKER